MDGLIAYALSKKYADEVGRSILDAGFKTQVEQDRSILQTTGQEKILYFIPKTTAKPSDGYDEYVYSNNAWEQVGATDVDLNYELLSNKPIILSKDNYRTHSETLVGKLFFPDFVMTDSDENNIKTYHISNLTGDALMTNSLPFRVFTDPLKRELFRDYGYYSNPPSDLFTNYSKAPTENGIWSIGDKNLQGLPVPCAGKLLNYMCDSSRVQIYATDNLSSQSSDYQYSNRYFVRTQYMGDLGTWKELGSSSQIVSGVVNNNGTITFTMSDGSTVTTTGQSVIGPQGAPGDDYVLTAQDKADIAGIVLNELQNADTMTFPIASEVNGS